MHIAAGLIKAITLCKHLELKLYCSQNSKLFYEQYLKHRYLIIQKI